MDVKTAIDNLLQRGDITKNEQEKLAAAGLYAVLPEAASELARGKGFTAAGQVIKNIAQTVGISAFAGLAGYQLYDLIKQKRNEAKGFNEMMKKTPILSEYPEEQVRDFYGVVQTFSPKSASNPLVSGALVNKMIQFGGVDHKIIQDLAQIEGPKKDILYDTAAAAGTSMVAFPDMRL